jgi:hypothetical protein
MKQLLLVICFYFTTNVFVFAQQTEKLTEILIIGVNHNRTKKINYKKLYQLLEKNKPDLILWEQSEDFVSVFGLRTAYRLKIFSSGTEQLALQVFNKKNRSIPILGFDTSFSSRKNDIKESVSSKQYSKEERVSKKNYIKESIRINDSFFTKLYQSKLNNEDSLKYRTYVNFIDNYVDDIYNKSLEEINLPSIYNKAKEIEEMESNVIIPLARKYMIDSIAFNEYIKDLNFGKARNSYLAQKVLDIASAQQGKRIIVLTGLSHKYFLTNELNKQTKMDLKLLSLQ